MKLNRLHYIVEAGVTFTRVEAKALVDLAKMHYDCTCVSAGLKSGEVGKFGRAMQNGFLAQLLMFKTTVIWPFRNFDITLKILEQRTLLYHGIMDKAELAAAKKLLEPLNVKLNSICDALNAEYVRMDVHGKEVGGL